MTEVNDRQVGGSHYKTKFQHWDFVMRCLAGRYLEGCATKYPSRWRKKNGLEDLKKSTHYVDKLIEEFTVGNYTPLSLMHSNVTQLNQEVARFCHANDLTASESEIIRLLTNWASLSDLLHVQELLASLIATEQVLVDEVEQMKQENP